MKNLSLILNAVLIVAVAFLYYNQFSSSSASEEVNSQTSNYDGDYSVVYINSDSVLVKYDYFKEIQGELQGQSQKLENEYKNRAEGLQREVNDFQRTVNSLTIGQAKALEEDLLKKQQNLQVYQQNLSQQLLKEEAKLNKQLYDKITTYLRKYSMENNIDLVVKFNQGSDVLYANDGMDVTNAVIEGLNAEYNTESQSDTGAVQDSTATE